MPSFRAYVLISQSEIQVETFFRESADHWIYRMYHRLEEALVSNLLDITRLMEAIYQRIIFEEASESLPAKS
ncbi:MAG: hypothetical protein HC880_07855 [Bacteroidia bacterium]|nr:hypothetical protein [Bacteroidia bacterium]